MYRFAKLREAVSRKIRRDRRRRLHDVSQDSSRHPIQQSKIIQFYSSVNNIGNYLPVLAIHQMLGQSTDMWCMHRQPVDFDYINEHYDYCIIGGAGLLHAGFEPFWESFGRHCRIPFMVWGVGACVIDALGKSSAVSPEVARSVFQRAELINVRDDTTAEIYNLDGVSITPCPTIEFLRRRRESVHAPTKAMRGRHVLFASHEELVSKEETEQIRTRLRREIGRFRYTRNIQTRSEGLDDIICLYERSRYVVTTRLHGAIIAYGLGVPYLAIARDEKLRSFARLYGGGTVVESSEQISRKLLRVIDEVSVTPDYGAVRQFGQKAREQIAGHCGTFQSTVQV